MYNEQIISQSTCSLFGMECFEEHPIGKTNPINLPAIDISLMGKTIGEKITSGNVGTIYKVKGSTTPRVYKVIPQHRFEDGNEVRISKIAGDLGVAPSFHQAFLVKQNLERYIFIEMEDAGRSLGKLMEDLAPNTEIHTSIAEETNISENEKAFREMIRKMQMENSPTFVVKEIVQKNKLSLEEVIGKLYKNQEAFYFDLLNKIKLLAKNCISYGDSHVGNIMFDNETSKGLQLIDFDAAKIMPDTKTAVLESLKSAYNSIHFDQFQKLNELSSDSQRLIAWFNKWSRLANTQKRTTNECDSQHFEKKRKLALENKESSITSTSQLKSLESADNKEQDT